MAFWKSEEPGVLPKWLFWFYVLLVPINLILTANYNIDTGRSSPPIAAAGAVGCAIAVRRNEVNWLFWGHVTGVLGALLILSLAMINATPIMSITSTGAFFASVYCVSMSLYLRGFHPIYSRFQFFHSERTSPEAAEPSSPDDYADELRLFEAGDWDKSLWAKHLVEAEGDAEKAKWRYIKERVGTAATRRSNEKKAREEEERRAYAEDQRLKREREERKRKQDWINKNNEAKRRSEGFHNEGARRKERKIRSLDGDRRRITLHFAYACAVVAFFVFLYLVAELFSP